MRKRDLYLYVWRAEKHQRHSGRPGGGRKRIFQAEARSTEVMAVDIELGMGRSVVAALMPGNVPSRLCRNRSPCSIAYRSARLGNRAGTETVRRTAVHKSRNRHRLQI